MLRHSGSFHRVLTPQEIEEKAYDAVDNYLKRNAVESIAPMQMSVHHYSPEGGYAKRLLFDHRLVVSRGDDDSITDLSEKGRAVIRAGGIRSYLLSESEWGRKLLGDLTPDWPLLGLIEQKIETGDLKIDAEIQSARELFLNRSATEEQMRSGCEKLSFVLEPLREKLKIHLDGDTEAFFTIVNNFNVRHNKATTKKIAHREQYEWVFYGMLNTINAYSKMIKKFP